MNHVFFNCDMAMELWGLVARWWQVDIPVFSSMLEWNIWIDTVHVWAGVRRCLEVVGLVLLWSIWSFCNKLLFIQVKPVKALILDHIQVQSYLWINSRNSKFNVSWVDWVCNPFFSINSL